MNIFFSWSGDLSRDVAELTNRWLKCVIQRANPWLSTHDIHKGTQWFNEISNSLATVSAGIIFLTQENKDKPWILFESGALAKGLSTNKVYTLLIDLKPHEITPPLSQFNATIIDNKDDFFKLINTINFSLSEHKLNDSTLKDVFEIFWPDFEKAYEQIVEKHKKPKTKEDKANIRTSDDMMIEILDTVRHMGSRIMFLENNRINNRGFDGKESELLSFIQQLKEEKNVLEKQLMSQTNEIKKIMMEYKVMRNNEEIEMMLSNEKKHNNMPKVKFVNKTQI